MSKHPLSLSEEAKVQMPMKTVASLIALVAIGTWAFFGIQEKYGIPPTYDDYTKDTIKDLQDLMNDLPLNQPWRIKPKDWIRSDKPMKLPEGFTPVGTAPLKTPMPDQKLVASMPQINQQTGLTRTQSALLSPSEQVIARRT